MIHDGAGLHPQGRAARVPAGVKLTLLLVLSTVLLALRSPVTTGVGALVVAAGYVLSGVGLRRLAAQVWTLRWVIVLLLPLQWWLSGPGRAAVVVGTLVVMVAAAALLTFTTGVSELLDVVTRLLRPLERFGVDTDRLSLLLALTVRTVPLLLDLARTAGEARSARGLDGSPRAVLVPYVVRVVKHAQASGDALAARGLD